MIKVYYEVESDEEDTPISIVVWSNADYPQKNVDNHCALREHRFAVSWRETLNQQLLRLAKENNWKFEGTK